MKKYIFVIIMLICLNVLATACGDDCSPLPQPKWELPQPIDSLLLGSWEAIDVDIDPYNSLIITFYENNKFIVRTEIYTLEEVYEYEYRWSINGDILVMPDFYDYNTGHFFDYKYNLIADGNLLYVELIKYPSKQKHCGVFDLVYRIPPLLISKGIFKKMEVKE